MGCGRSNDCLFAQCCHVDEKEEVPSPPSIRQDEENPTYARHLYKAHLCFSAGLKICRVPPAKDLPSGESEGAIQVRIRMKCGCIS